MLMNYIYTLLLPFVPIAGALMCILILCLGPTRRSGSAWKSGTGTLPGFFASQIVMWFSTLVYNYAPGTFVYLSGFSYFTILSVQVCLFHFVFRITQQRSDERFSCVHYLIPLAIAVVQEVWTLLVPFDVTLGLVESKGVPSADYPIYSAYFLFKIKMRMIFSTVYTVWALVRIYRYRRMVMDYSADEERMSLGWLRLLVFLTIIQMFLPMTMVFQERSYFFTAPFIMPISTLLLLVQFALLCGNFMTGNYVQIETGTPGSAGGDAPLRGLTDVDLRFDAGSSSLSAGEPGSGSEALHPGSPAGDNVPLPGPESKRIYRDTFEGFMSSRKPYLDAQLRIIDLAAELGTNRSYLSSFINETYGMNFSQFINGYRMREFYRLVEEYPEANKSELVMKVGFGSYRSFARIEKELGKLE